MFPNLASCGKQDRDFRGNPGVPVECTFKQQRDEFTVTCGASGGAMKGRLSGRNVGGLGGTDVALRAERITVSPSVHRVWKGTLPKDITEY